MLDRAELMRADDAAWSELYADRLAHCDHAERRAIWAKVGSSPICSATSGAGWPPPRPGAGRPWRIRERDRKGLGFGFDQTDPLPAAGPKSSSEASLECDPNTSRLLVRSPGVEHALFLLARQAGGRVVRGFATLHPLERVRDRLLEPPDPQPVGECPLD
jgi:hypothetical protein